MTIDLEIFIAPEQIETDRLIIRPFKTEEEMIDLYQKIMPGDERILKVTSKKVREGLLDIKVPFTEYLVMNKEEEKLGYVSLSIDAETSVAEWCRYFLDSAQGKGYGVEALIALNENIVQPSIGKKYKYIANPIESYNYESWEGRLEVKTSEFSFIGAYAFMETMVANYPSLSSDIKAGAKALTILGNAVIFAFGKDLEDAMPAESLRSLSKKLFSNYKDQSEHEDITSDIVSLIKSTSEPHSVISLAMRLMAEKNAINSGTRAIENIKIISYASVSRGILEEMDIIDNVQDAFKDLKEKHQVSTVLSCALDDYFGMNKQSFNLFEEQLSSSQTDESEILGSGITEVAD